MKKTRSWVVAWFWATGLCADTTEGLPLKRGYYVASDVACSEASNSTVALLRHDGIGGARDFCTFMNIEQVRPSNYRVTQSCRNVGDNTPAEISVITYLVTGDTAFISRNEYGWEFSARLCPQSSMPPEWQSNDIAGEIK